MQGQRINDASDFGMLTAAAAQFSRPFAAALCSLAMISGAGAWAQDAAPRGPGEGGGLSAIGAPAGPGVGARDGGFPESGDHSEAPVIAAPSDPGRWAPSPSSGYVPSEMGGFNSFAAGDAAPPPLPEHYGFNPAAQPR